MWDHVGKILCTCRVAVDGPVQYANIVGIQCTVITAISRRMEIRVRVVSVGMVRVGSPIWITTTIQAYPDIDSITCGGRRLLK